jgi:hypothetical protein
MGKTNPGGQRFFSTLAALIRIAKFILVGGGYFRNFIWLLLLAILGTFVDLQWHPGAFVWCLFILAVVIARFIIERTLVGLSVWVSRNLSANEDENFTDSTATSPDTSGFQEYEQRHKEIAQEPKE